MVNSSSLVFTLLARNVPLFHWPTLIPPLCAVLLVLTHQRSVCWTSTVPLLPTVALTLRVPPPFLQKVTVPLLFVVILSSDVRRCAEANRLTSSFPVG